MVKVSINLSAARQKLSTKALQAGQRALANQAAADMNQFVPKDEGHLRLAMSIDTDGSAINYHMPYAAELFYMHKYNYTTPGTGPRWDNKAKGFFISSWIESFSRGAGW